MAAGIDQAALMYQNLETAWNSGNDESILKLLPQMKMILLNLSFLPSSTQSEKPEQKELYVARGTLEIGALWSIQCQDIPSFQRYVAQLKCYYFDYGSLLPESSYKYQILGLNLLSLLAQNRLAEFHTEMELLSPEEQKNLYIKYPIRLEQFLMEGSFHKVFLEKVNIPAQNYSLFVDILINTMRDEIASCAEKAYSKLSIMEATKTLMMDNQESLMEYAARRKWEKDPSEEFFLFTKDETNEELHFVRNSALISQALGYAQELEKIV